MARKKDKAARQQTQAAEAAPQFGNGITGDVLAREDRTWMATAAFVAAQDAFDMGLGGRFVVNDESTTWYDGMFLPDASALDEVGIARKLAGFCEVMRQDINDEILYGSARLAGLLPPDAPADWQQVPLVVRMAYSVFIKVYRELAATGNFAQYLAEEAAAAPAQGKPRGALGRKAGQKKGGRKTFTGDGKARAKAADAAAEKAAKKA